MRTAPSLRRLLDRFEQDSRLDRVADRAEAAGQRLGSTSAGPLLRGGGLGHPLHPLLTDLPIGCWTSATVLDLVGGRRSRRAATRLVGLGVATVPVVAAAGLVDVASIDDRRTRRVGAAHAVGNVVATMFYVWSWRDRRRGRHLRGVLLGLIGGTLASVTGYLGGHLAFAANGHVGASHGAGGAGVDRGETGEVVAEVSIDPASLG